MPHVLSPSAGLSAGDCADLGGEWLMVGSGITNTGFEHQGAGFGVLAFGVWGLEILGLGGQ